MGNFVSHPILENRELLKRSKIVSAAEAVGLIRDGDTVAVGGFVGIGMPETLLKALGRRFLQGIAGHPAGTPQQLTLVYGAGQGDGKEQGLVHISHAGLLKRIIAGHYGISPALQRLAMSGLVEAYNLPLGVMSQLFRDIAAGKPGQISTVGLGTFVDPLNGGGKVNARTTEDLVERIHLRGQDYLFYHTFPIHVAILRGTTADTDGNITLEREALSLDTQALAMAAHNSGGIVIVQVERIAERGTLNPRQVKIPGVLVDCVVVAEQPEEHRQSVIETYNPAYASELRVPLSSIPPLPMDERKIIARRAAFELMPNSVVNLGIGMPEGVARVAAEEGIFDLITLTAEPD